MQKTFTLQANSHRTFKVSGSVFAIIDATADVDVELDKGGAQTMIEGRKISGEKFKKITFIETSGSDNTITFHAGDEDIVLTSPTPSVSATIGSSTATPAQFLKTSATPGSPVSLTAGSTLFKTAKIIARKNRNGFDDPSEGASAASNDDVVCIGATNNSNQLPMRLTQGDEVTINAPVGSRYNFQDWYLDVGTSGDGVVVIYST